MYKLRVSSYFSGAHSLREYKGKCEALHGHNWKVEIEVASPRLNASGLVIDFGELKKALKEVLAELDHKYLNELEFFSPREENGGGNNPTSELIAYYIFMRMKEKVSPAACRISQVCVWETSASCAIYQE